MILFYTKIIKIYYLMKKINFKNSNPLCDVTDIHKHKRLYTQNLSLNCLHDHFS